MDHRLDVVVPHWESVDVDEWGVGRYEMSTRRASRDTVRLEVRRQGARFVWKVSMSPKGFTWAAGFDEISDCRPSLPDGGWELIRDYYRQTGFHHVNHNIIVQNRILEENPWVAMELYIAFERSKQVAYQRARENLSGYLYMGGREFAEQAEVFGEDPYPLGINKMGKNIERAIQGSYEQGLLRRPLALDEVYFRTTLDT